MTYSIFQSVEIRILKGSQVLLNFLTAERDVISNDARNRPPPL